MRKRYSRQGASSAKNIRPGKGISLLSAEKLPLIGTLLFSVMGILLNYLIKQTLEAPAIEYNRTILSEKTVGDTVFRTYNYAITNVSKDRSFKNLTVNFEYPTSIHNNTWIYNDELFTPEPSSLHGTSTMCLQNLLLIDSIAHLQPFAQYIIRFDTKTFKITSHPHVYLSCDDTVNFHEANFFSWLAKNQIAVNVVLLILFFILIVLYLLIFLKK